MTVPTLGEPNVALNFDVPSMKRKEKAFAEYCYTEKRLVEGKPTLVPMNWLPPRALLKDEHFLCAFGLGLKYPQSMLNLGDLPYVVFHSLLDCLVLTCVFFFSQRL